MCIRDRERINPTGKKRLKEALRNGDMDYLLREAVAQRDAGAHILDVNVGCLLYTSPSPRDRTRSRMPSSA